MIQSLSDHPSTLPGSAVSRLSSLPALPMEYVSALKPWFTKKTIKAAFRLLTDGEPLHLLLYRQSCGGIFRDGITATVRMAEGHGKRAWVFRDGSCSPVH